MNSFNAQFARHMYHRGRASVEDRLLELRASLSGQYLGLYDQAILREEVASVLPAEFAAQSHRVRASIICAGASEIRGLKLSWS